MSVTTYRAQNPRLNLIPFLVIVAFLITWEILASAKMISALFFPAPSTIFDTFVELFQEGTLLPAVRISVARIAGGFVFGGVTGLILGLAMGWSARVRSVFDPLVAAIHPIPKIALLPIILIVLGFGEQSRIFMISISAFFQMLINSMGGVLQIGPTYFDAARNYGANRLQIFRHVVLPGSLPSILTGARLALNTCLGVTLAIELRFAREGLGTLLWLSWETLQVEILFVVVAILSLMGLVINLGLRYLKDRTIHWKY